MARTAKDSSGFHLDVTGSDTSGWVLMVDNLGSEGVTPYTHQFAAVVVDADQKRAFIADLATAMGVDVYLPTDSLVKTAVNVHDYQEEFDPGDWDGPRYAVSGDVDDFLTHAEAVALEEKWNKLNLDNGSWSGNYYVQDLAEVAFPNEYKFESEGMCFFAYTDDKSSAERLAAWINGKDFLK